MATHLAVADLTDLLRSHQRLVVGVPSSVTQLSITWNLAKLSQFDSLSPRHISIPATYFGNLLLGHFSSALPSPS